MVARGGHLTVEGTLPERVPRDRGVLRAVEELLRLYRSPSLPDLPPLHGGVVGYIGYDVVREVEHLPHVPPDDLGFPDAVLSVIGQLAAFDHWRQRVTLIESVVSEVLAVLLSMTTIDRTRMAPVGLTIGAVSLSAACTVINVEARKHVRNDRPIMVQYYM